MFAAVPTAHQPCGANGCQLSCACEGSATEIATASTSDQHRGKHELEARGDAQTEGIRGSTVPNMASPTDAATAVPEPVRSAT